MIALQYFMTWLCFWRGGLLIDRNKGEGDRRKRAVKESEKQKIFGINKSREENVQE